MFTFIENLSKEEFNQFVNAQETTPLLQSYQWAKVKDTFQPHYIGVKKETQLVATALILVRKLPLNQKLAYLPRGPILDYQNQELLNFFTENLKQYASKIGCFLIRIDPAVDYKRYIISDQANAQPLDKGVQTIDNLKKAGFIHRGLPYEFSDSFQPRLSAIIHINQETQKNYQKKLNKSLRYTQKRKTQVFHAHIEYLDSLAEMIKLTEERQQVQLRNKDYFKVLLDTYPNDANITIAALKPKESILSFNEEIKKRELEIEQIKDKSPKKVFHLNEQIESYQSLIKELQTYIDRDEIIMGALLSIVYGNTMNLLYAGTDVNFTKFFPQEIIYDSLVQKAQELNLKYIDMGGVEGNLDDGLTIFKSQFTPFIHEYIGEFDLPLSYKYKIFNLAWSLRKKIKQLKNSRKA